MGVRKDLKEWIDGASYVDLLRKHRFGSSNDPIFQGDAGRYFVKVKMTKGNQIGSAARVSASKQVGWVDG